MNKTILQIVCIALILAFPCGKASGQYKKIPVVVITDLYHPYQDPGDNMDLIMGFGLPDVDLKAVLLDITDAFRKDTADHPTLWKDPRGPREAGIIPVEQLSYIFNKRIPYGIGPLSMMKSEEDRMEYLPGYEQEAIDKYLSLFTGVEQAEDGISYLADTLGDYLDAEIVQNMKEIASAVNATKTASFELVFDPTLVRGMSYYTGPIFEISMDEFGGSVGGGGRYDEMIGKFTGNNTSACGFSIGFERIVMLLLERGYQIPTAKTKKAYLIEKNMPADKLCEVLKEARAERKLSQAQLADMVGVSRNTISSIETGQFNPTAKLALILCIALDKKFEELFYF